MSELESIHVIGTMNVYISYICLSVYAGRALSKKFGSMFKVSFVCFISKLSLGIG